jgi:hypothetical protein
MEKNKQQLSEDLKRFNSIMGYSVEGKRKINEAPEDEEGDFDFAKDIPAADEQGGEGQDEQPQEGGEEGNSDFDFGDEGSPEGEEQPTEDGGQEDEFGTAGEFSAADDIETDEEVEEIDVTDIVAKSDAARETAERAAQSSEDTYSYVKDLMDKFSNLEAQLGKMDAIMDKVSKIDTEIKTPEEKLELRSLDSYPFNMKLTDYWSDKLGEKDNNYQVTDNDEERFEIKSDDLTDYNELDIKNSFNPQK